MLQSLENARKDDPYGLASKWIDYALRENARTVEELLAEVSRQSQLAIAVILVLTIP
jgi:hypothetical protein